MFLTETNNLLNLSDQVKQLVVKRLHNLETNKKRHGVQIMFTVYQHCLLTESLAVIPLDTNQSTIISQAAGRCEGDSTTFNIQ